MDFHLLKHPIHLTFLLLSIVSLTKAQDDGPSDVEVMRKCGFSLQGIHDCKYQKCADAAVTCTDAHAGNPDDISTCQLKTCMDIRKVCEEPLNKYLTTEEKCEGDGFIDVDSSCLLSDRSSADAMSKCKHKGYLQVKRACFVPEWKRRIEDHALKKLNVHALSKEAEECAYNKCFKGVEDCLSEHHQQLIDNPSAKRKFNIDQCAYVAVDYPHECEKIESITGCVDSLQTCISEHPAPKSNMGIVIGIIVGVVLVGGIVGALLYLRHKRIGPFSPPRNPGNPVPQTAA